MVNMMKYQKPTGTMDFFPEDMELRKKVFDSLRNTAERFGFKEVESPAFESIELLTKKSGEEITNQIFVLEQKGEGKDKKERFGLRFDLTVPFTRMFVEKQKELAKPVKWFGISRMWRYERPQQGRLREFYQLSVEVFGSDKPEADAEIINLAVECLKDLGLSEKDFYVRLNNRKLLQGILEQLSDSKDKKVIDSLISLVDKKEKIGEEEFSKALEEIGVKEIEKLKKILAVNDIKEFETIELNKTAQDGLEELKNIIKLIDSKFVKLDLTTARGLAYYTGTVFELFDKSGKYRALAGGGRYDNMVELFNGEPCPATGFAIGYATLSLLLKEKGLAPKPDTGVEYYVIAIGDDVVKEKALNLVMKLRKKYSADWDIMGRSLAKQMSYANTINAKNVIIIGDEELKTGKIKIKDMKTGKEKTVNMEEF